MNFLIICIFIFSNLISLLKSSNDFSNLNLNQFNILLERYDYSLVFFHSTANCTFTNCQQLLDTNENLVNKLKIKLSEKKFSNRYDKFVNFINIDCYRNKKLLKSYQKDNELCNAYSAIDLPQWILFQFGIQFKRINNMFIKSNLIDFINQQIKTISIRFDSIRKLITFLKKSREPVVVGLFLDINDRLVIDRWLSAIEKTKMHWNYKNVVFCHLFKNYSNGDLKDFENYMGEKINLPMIIIARQTQMIHKREKPFLSYDLSSNREDISEWIKRKIFGLIIWRSRDNENEIQHPLIVAYYDFDFKSNQISSYKWRNMIYNQAIKNSDLNFALSNAHTFRKYLNKYQLTIEDYEPLFIAYDIFHYGYKFDDIFSTYEFSEFLNEFRNCKLEPIHEKSNYVNLNQEYNQIIELSTRTFPKYVICSKKDVFIHAYASSCKHCKESKLAMKDLHAKLHKEDELLITQIDADVNDLPPKLNAETFPTFYLYRSKDSKILKYDSTKNIVMIINFLASEVSKELVAFKRDGQVRTIEEQLIFLQKKIKNNSNEISNGQTSNKKVNKIKTEL